MRSQFASPIILLSLLTACVPQAVVNPDPQASVQPSAQPSPSSSATPAASASPQPSSQTNPSPTTSPTGVQPTAEPTNVPQPGASAGINAVSLRLSSPSRYFNYSGETIQLKPELLDAAGRVLATPAGLIWTSSRPAELSVNSQGQVKAVGSYGSSEIRVSLPGTELSASLTLSISLSGGGGGGGNTGSSGGGTVTPPVIQSISASQYSVTGAGVPIQLNATADSGVSYSWSCLSAGCSTFESSTGPSVLWRTPSASGTYILQVSVSLNGLTSTQTMAITVSTGSTQVNITT